MFQIHIWYTDLLFFYYEARPVNFEWDLFIESVASGTQPSRINKKINKKICKDEKSKVFASTGSRHNLGQKQKQKNFRTSERTTSLILHPKE